MGDAIGSVYRKEKEYSDYSPEEFQKLIDKTSLNTQRGAAILKASGAKSDLAGNSFESDYSSNSLFGGSGGSKGGSGSLFGAGGLYDSALEKSKDIAKFRLGLDQEQAKFFRGLREEESQSDFGRTTSLEGQKIKGQYDLQKMMEDAISGRQTEQLKKQKEMQQADFDQTNLFRAHSAALALRGLR